MVALVADVERRLGPVGAVVANATGPQPEAGVEELTWRGHLDQLEFFVKSPTLLVQAALPGMRALGGGRIIMIGSDLADRAAPRTSAYVAAKNAQVGLAKVWAKELGPDNITVNVVQPGGSRSSGTKVSTTSAYRRRCRCGGWGRPTTSQRWSPSSPPTPPAS